MSGSSGRPSTAVVGELVSEILRRQGLEAKVEEYRAWLVWDAVVGPQIAARARPLRIREGVLEVRVEQAVWMQQLQLMKLQILDKLNARLGRVVVRDIFWRRGRVDTVTGKKLADPGRPWLQEVLDAQERERVEAVVAALPDADISQALRSVLQRQLQLDKNRGKSTQL